MPPLSKARLLNRRRWGRRGMPSGASLPIQPASIPRLRLSLRFVAARPPAPMRRHMRHAHVYFHVYFHAYVSSEFSSRSFCDGTFAPFRRPDAQPHRSWCQAVGHALREWRLPIAGAGGCRTLHPVLPLQPHAASRYPDSNYTPACFRLCRRRFRLLPAVQPPGVVIPAHPLCGSGARRRLLPQHKPTRRR